MLPCACAPPPKIWICGTGIATCRSPARNFHSGFFAAAAAACAQASDTATMALPPRRDLSGVPSSAMSVLSISSWFKSFPDKERSRISVFTPCTACLTSMLFASPDPVDAPAGAIARPRAPFTATSASTVARPRESQTLRARTSRIFAMRS